MLDKLFSKPEWDALGLSPDGGSILALRPWKNRMNVFLIRRESEDVVRLTSHSDRDVVAPFWVDDTTIAYRHDPNGDERWQLNVVDIDSCSSRRLTRNESAIVMEAWTPPRPDGRIFALYNGRNPALFDIIELNPGDGSLVVRGENPGNVIGWQVDHRQRPRIMISSDGYWSTVHYLDDEGDSIELVQTSFRDTFIPFGFTVHGSLLFAGSNIGRDRVALVLFDIQRREEVDVLFEHPRYDVRSVILTKDGRIAAADFLTDRQSYYFFDQRYRDAFRAARAIHPADACRIESVDDDESVFLMRLEGDIDPGRYVLIDKANETVEEWGERRPGVDVRHLHRTETISFRTRDHMLLRGFITKPNRRVRQPYPMLVLIHGGPEERDVWRFNPVVQYLVGLGIAVLQINFRGSTGYGKQYWAAHFKEWGGAMQDDIVDGVQWAVMSGYAQADRVAVYGASYGGYSALMGLCRTPGLFRCAIEEAGPTDLVAFLDSFPEHWKPLRETMYEKIGHPDYDRDMLEARSPANLTDRITSPLLVIHGENDFRVPPRESERLVAALRDQGKNVEHLVLAGEGHSASTHENVVKKMKAIGAFLRRHLLNPGTRI